MERYMPRHNEKRQGVKHVYKKYDRFGGYSGDSEETEMAK